MHLATLSLHHSPPAVDTDPTPARPSSRDAGPPHQPTSSIATTRRWKRKRRKVISDERREPIAPTNAALPGRARHKDLLRFITCGSVDDGKSTLIGRLLYESKALLDDQLTRARRRLEEIRHAGRRRSISRCSSTASQAEREQGITIDVAYRFFATDKRKFIVADTPGHEQYTRNMVTGASTADLAVILVDARKGVLTQTRRHSYLVSLLGIRHVVLAINKLDLVGYSREVFDLIDRDYREFAGKLGFDDDRQHSAVGAARRQHDGARARTRRGTRARA